MFAENQFTQEIFKLKNRLMLATEAFKNGKPILVGDDGIRENEADLVFHAQHATPQNVNFAVTHAKGLLCVSVSHDIANKLGFHTSPKIPGEVPHTNFTLSVDAKIGITNGISAKDRAHTIALMANPNATHSDFISPGHVFPVRAMQGGLLARTGHTEALFELCSLADLPHAAAMCEILGDDGNAISPTELAKNHSTDNVFYNIPFLSTVDILWNKILFHKSTECKFRKTNNFVYKLNKEKPKEIFVLEPGLEAHITLKTIVAIYQNEIRPETLRMTISNALHQWDNGVTEENCCAQISMVSFENCLEEMPDHIYDFCDMSAKEGLKSTKTSVQRVISILRVIQFLKDEDFIATDLKSFILKIKLFNKIDKDFLISILN